MAQQNEFLFERKRTIDKSPNWTYSFVLFFVALISRRPLLRFIIVATALVPFVFACQVAPCVTGRPSSIHPRSDGRSEEQSGKRRRSDGGSRPAGGELPSEEKTFWSPLFLFQRNIVFIPKQRPSWSSRKFDLWPAFVLCAF